MSTEKLVEYMKYRAAVEKTFWDIPEQFLEEQFNSGVREFFGVKLTDSGRIVNDGQNPGALVAYQQNRKGTHE